MLDKTQALVSAFKIVLLFTHTGTWLMMCCIEKPGLKMFLHFFHRAPSVVKMFSLPASGSSVVAKVGCLSRSESWTCRATSL
jgi:hypothetical protein